MFDKGEVPEGMSSSDRTILEKDAELEIMRKNKSEQRDYFKKLEEGKMDNQEHKEPKLMVGRIKDKLADGGEEFNEDVPEMASVASKFSFFEKQKEREEEERQKKQSRKTPPRLTKSHIVSNSIILPITFHVNMWINRIENQGTCMQTYSIEYNPQNDI